MCVRVCVCVCVCVCVVLFVCVCARVFERALLNALARQVGSTRALTLSMASSFILTSAHELTGRRVLQACNEEFCYIQRCRRQPRPRAASVFLNSRPSGHSALLLSLWEGKGGERTMEIDTSLDTSVTCRAHT